MNRRKLVLAAVLALLVLYPFFPFVDMILMHLTGTPLRLERQLVNIFIFAILAVGLNIQVGYAGLLQLGIAAFFAIGAFTAGILTVEKYPFQIGFWGALLAAPSIAAAAGLALGAPTIRLRGDYLAIVTLGFGEVVRVVLLNLENITDGPRGLNPIPPPWMPDFVTRAFGADRSFALTMYFVSLLILAALVVVFRNMERTRLGRSFAALREDELACACMGVNPSTVKLAAFSIGAAIAGLAGALYATNLTTTAEPNTYDFAYSIMVLCCVIIGGIGSLPGVIVGSFVLLGFDNILSPLIARMLQSGASQTGGSVLLTPSNWRWLFFGAALVLMMRFRPTGIWPSAVSRKELSPAKEGR